MAGAAWHSPWRMTADGFLEAVRAALGGEAFEVAVRAGLAERLEVGLAAVRARWPEAPHAGEDFAAYLAARLSHQGSLHEAARRLQFEDLFLAWWAGSGDRAGIAAFEASFSEDIGQLVARFASVPADELRERLRAKLFIGSGSAGPRIRDYSGFGVLQGWLRVTASRAFVDAARSDSPTEA